MIGAGAPQLARVGHFTTRAAALAFATAVLAIVVLPLVNALLGEPDRATVYRAFGGVEALERSHYEALFVDDSPLDVVVAGASRTWTAIGPKHLEAALRRPIRFLTLGHNLPSEDLRYVVLSDLLERRQVGLVLLGSPPRRQSSPHRDLHEVLQLGKHAHVLDGLPWRETVQLYALFVLGGPRTTLSRWGLGSPAWTGPADALQRGALIRAWGWKKQRPFAPFSPAPPQMEKPIHPDHPLLSYEPDMSVHQQHFLELTLELLASRGVRTAMLVPPPMSERHNSQVVVRAPKALLSKFGVAVVSAPPGVLFAGLNEDEMKQLYYDGGHFNANGNRFFTHAVAPAIGELSP